MPQRIELTFGGISWYRDLPKRGCEKEPSKDGEEWGPDGPPV